MKYWKLIKSTSHMDDVNINMNAIPEGFNDTILDDEEVNNVLSMLLDFQEKYFSETPLADTLEKKFVWNIPKSIYNMANKIWQCGLPDGMNPIYWLYGLCLDDPETMLCKFLITAVNSIPEDEYAEIEKNAALYDELPTDDDC